MVALFEFILQIGLRKEYKASYEHADKVFMFRGAAWS